MTTAVTEKYDLEEAIDAIVDRYEAKQTALIMILQDIQKHHRYLPIEALKMVAKKMELPMAQVFGVATFYRSFSLTPKGKHHVCVCTGTACHVRQANVIVDKFQRELGIDPGGTTSDLKYSLETVNCLGACALGPLITVDDSFYGNMTVTKVDKILARLNKGESADEEEEA
ncbi:MAG TPA: NAD(P)H-dependent oxidoreductase subunit E [candidate division Zixibacteria bacterium]|nr:NAD(P)H-dependent oxidoreductase subunit E [candidate division Zixibacteria bacterium]